jgi:transglutaminase-like putative cysteine protease
MPLDPNHAAATRVRLRYCVELDFRAQGCSEFLLNVHAARTSGQSIVEEAFAVSPVVPVKLDVDAATGTRIASFGMEEGAVAVRYEATVDLRHRIVDPASIVPESPAALPAQTLRYLYPSRYCESDVVGRQAWDQFGHLARGYGQVRAVRDWIHGALKFQVGISGSSTSAVDTLRHGAGVCRDFAHTMIAFCRALNYPARFVTGVDYGADPVLGPPDFHAYVEVFVGGAWFVFDPTGISPTTGLVRIGTGRDAAVVSFATILGPVQTAMPRVRFDAVEDPAAGFAPPAPTNLAVSTLG